MTDRTMDQTARIHTMPMREIPAWAVLQRRLFDAIEEAWREFSRRYCEPGGGIRASMVFEDRDGVDDLYEPFFNWPAFYELGGSDEVLAAAKHHWEGVTRQLGAAGMLTDEFENGYDWFHQGESLLLFYGLCAADPADERFAERARRFAELYTDPAHGNFDPVHTIITAPHNGALGPRPGLGAEWVAYSGDRLDMRPYGLPLHDVPGVHSWEDLHEPANAARMGQAMQERASGDVAVNIAATSLVANRWLYDGDQASADWVLRYIDGWRRRADANGGLMPDSVALDGSVGGNHAGRWHGGHYGWTWPHGIHSVAMSALVGTLNAAMISGETEPLDLVRTMLDTVIEQAIHAPLTETEFSLKDSWLAKFAEHSGAPALLVPHRYGRDGWFDYGPLSLDMPTWLWWWTREEADRERLDRLIAGQPVAPDAVVPFRDKTEAGHEAPWLAFLSGQAPDYPERALSMALGQVARRLAVMEAEPIDPDTVHLHFWQRVNPVVTEVLSQLITGTPQVLYNGGLPFAAVSYRDADRDRPGLPPDVAALVRRLDSDATVVEIANLSRRPRRLWVRPGKFGERHIQQVRSTGRRNGDYPADSTAYTDVPGTPFTESCDVQAPQVLVELPPSHRVELTLVSTPAPTPPRHRGAAARSTTQA